MTGGHTRIHTLDAVRGIAVMSILLMNIAGFGLPAAAYFNPLAYGAETPADLWTWAVNFVLVDGKMRGLFSFMFGASMLLVIERAEAAGRSPAAAHFARMIALLGFGIAHFALIWYGDILLHYAVIGMIAYAFTGASTRALLLTGIGAFAIATVIFALVAVSLVDVRHEALMPGASAEVVSTWQDIVDGFGVPAAAKIANELAIYRDGYAGMVVDRVIVHGPDTVRILLFGGFETLGLMLFGMAGLRNGFLTGAWERARYRRWALVAYAVGIPPMIALAALTWENGFDPLTVFTTAFVSSPLRPIIMIGHASMILLLLKGAAGWLPERLAAAGRMAFSNYLGTSLLMTTLFYGFGLGWFGTLSRTELYLIPPVVWALILFWSKPWLERFHYGPLEWLWRSLARWQIQPLRR